MTGSTDRDNNRPNSHGANHTDGFDDEDFARMAAEMAAEDARHNAEAAGIEFDEDETAALDAATARDHDSAHDRDTVLDRDTAPAGATRTVRTEAAQQAHDDPTAEHNVLSPEGAAAEVDLDDADSGPLPPDQLAHNAIVELLTRYDIEKRPIPRPERLARHTLQAINIAVDRENGRRLARKQRARIAAGEKNAQNTKLGNDERAYQQRVLTPANIAQLLLATKHIINIAPSGRLSDPELDMLSVYDDRPSSPTYGTYLTSEITIHTLARNYNRDLSINEMKETMRILKEQAPHRPRDADRDLIAVGNGIVNYRTKKLQPFSHEHIFLSKAQVNYNPEATNVICHNDADGTDWDVESWMSELSDDPELVELLWQIIGATLRPYVDWNKSAWFYSEQGNNGKGTLVQLMRNVMGSMAHTSIPISDFAKDFALEPLTQASAILVDENDVGTFIDKAANLKAVITNDVISINRKFRTPISYQFRGFMVQCLNEFPKIKDKSESFYRRQLFVPFTKCFTGAERKYIKSDYIARTDVLEYVLWRVINMPDYYDFTEPAATRLVLDEYKEFNDPVRAFLTEYDGRFAWDLLPFPFLYDLYKAWLREAMPSSTPLGRNTFIKDFVTIATSQTGTVVDDYVNGRVSLDELHDVWVCPSTSARHRAPGLMACAEPIIAEANLDAWKNPAFGENHPNHTYPVPREFYSGVIRADVYLRTYFGETVIDAREAQLADPDYAAATWPTSINPATGQLYTGIDNPDGTPMYFTAPDGTAATTAATTAPGTVTGADTTDLTTTDGDDDRDRNTAPRATTAPMPDWAVRLRAADAARLAERAPAEQAERAPGAGADGGVDSDRADAHTDPSDTVHSPDSDVRMTPKDPVHGRTPHDQPAAQPDRRRRDSAADPDHRDLDSPVSEPDAAGAADRGSGQPGPLRPHTGPSRPADHGDDPAAAGSDGTGNPGRDAGHDSSHDADSAD